jgi:16S rRNA (guanine(527)-N(7))-methyltransferase RsmG
VSSSIFAERLFQRTASFDIAVSAAQADQLERYYVMLRRWNRRMNLTALPLEIPPADEVLDRLFLEPLIAAALIENQPIKWVDVGYGGGSPAIPLKVVRAELELTMVEPKGRKAAFLREAVRHLELETAGVLTERIESIAVVPNSVDLITIRAVRMDGPLFECLKVLLTSTGRLITFGPQTSAPGYEQVAQLSLPGTASFVSMFQPTNASSGEA